MSSALQELLARKRALEAVSTPAPAQGQVTSGPDEGAAETGVETGAETSASPEAATASRQPVEDEPGKEPFGVAQVVTPNGIEIYFQAGPKRLYRLRGLYEETEGVWKPDPDEDWREVPSMSDIKDVLDKAGLPWWGQGVGVRGVLTLVSQGLIDLAFVDPVTIDGLVDLIQGNKSKGIKGLLSQHKLTVNHTLDKAADRGTTVHKGLEAWAEKGAMPVPDVYPPHERGYVQGVVDFLTHSGATALASEVMVGSLEWGFAGRFDLIAWIPDGAEVYVHRTEKGRGDRMEKVPGGRWLLDLKTSKDVYESHQLQCAGYELAYQESYGDYTDYQGVIQVSEDGRYKLVQSRATVDHFQNLKCLYDSLEEIG